MPAPRNPPPSKASPSPALVRLRARKGQVKTNSASIDTNISAHPRTEPVKALGVLLKLLSSLPSRIGGCQYRLTPAEHALSLHLVSILDPYVYHSARALAPTVVSSAIGLVDQPTEILDTILSHVDERRDLFNVGLTCKRLSDVVFPRHFEYRVIKCKISSIGVWNHLVVHRDLARNVRRLEILDERTSLVGGIISNAKGSTAMPKSNPKSTSALIPKRILTTDTDLESTDDELRLHSKQERYFVAALARMTGLQQFKWSCVHSPISLKNVWDTLMLRAPGLKEMHVFDNLVFAPRALGAGDEESESSEESGSDSENEQDHSQTTGASKPKGFMARIPSSALLEMRSLVFRSTSHSYGAAKLPELGRITGILHQCVNLTNLEITFVQPRTVNTTPIAPVALSGVARPRPLADEFLLYTKLPKLRSVTLNNLRCVSPPAAATFLSWHKNLEVLNLDIHGGAFAMSGYLPDGSLPILKEIKANKEVINAILDCPVGTDEKARPIEAVKGFKLSGHQGHVINTSSTRTVADATFLSNLKSYASSITKIEMLGWREMEDVKKIVAVAPGLKHLDLGRRVGSAAQRNANTNSVTTGPATNLVEWTEVLATLPELTSLHGVKFFYEIASLANSNHKHHDHDTESGSEQEVSLSANGPVASPISTAPTPSYPVQLSMMERSRMRKNDEIAGVLAWKCKKLRRVDHWEDCIGISTPNKVIVLLRDRDGVKWEVRRVRA